MKITFPINVSAADMLAKWTESHFKWPSALNATSARRQVNLSHGVRNNRTDRRTRKTQLFRLKASLSAACFAPRTANWRTAVVVVVAARWTCEKSMPRHYHKQREQTEKRRRTLHSRTAEYVIWIFTWLGTNSLALYSLARCERSRRNRERV